MATRTPIEFAELLGLTQGADAAPVEVVSLAKPDLLRHILSKSTDEIFSYFYEFDALYTPCLLRTYFSLPTEFGLEWSLFHAVATRTTESPTFTRFVREHPKEACGFLSTLSRQIAAFQEDGRETLTDADEKFLDYLAALFTTIYISLMYHLPSDFPFPSLEEGIRRDFVIVVDLLLRRGVGREDGMIMLQSFARGGTKVKDLEDVEGGPFAGWWMCELRGDRTRGGSGATCVERERGKEMDACSRCLCVRYCSKEHQKLDWKRHKISCFKPSW